MKKNIADHLPLRDRESFLRDNCDDTERMNYLKAFTEDEIVEMKNRLSSVSIEMDDIEDEKKDVNAHFKAKLDPLKNERKSLLKNIKQKAILVVEDCFKFIDYENKRVEYYNAVGDLIESRPLSPGENQRKMFPMRSGTED